MSLIRTRTCVNPLEGRAETIFQDMKGHEYRRIVGGMAWPSGDVSGFAVVVGEDLRKDVTVNDRGYRILAECSQVHISDLIKWAYEAQSQYMVKPWLGDTKNRAMMEFVSRFNKSNQQKSLLLQDAPHLDDPHAFEFYLYLISEKTKPSKKILHFGKSLLANALMSFQPESMRMASAQKYPAIRSLGYAVSYLDIYDPSRHGDDEMAREKYIKLRDCANI